MTRPLPEPGTRRWQPLRAGLVDLFYYDTEEFWFRDGRLLLRGNNGTGKSKVLALTLPFLLDGDLAAHRVEPDADPKKKMEWNLLLGGAHPYPERLGYTWLELGRVDEDGTTEFRTLGCGLKAVSGKGIARHWFFLTALRVGADLNLVDATGTALARDRLAEALGEHGTVFDRAKPYRRAVDEAMFGFGEQRYGALVDLLIQLRQPQLSKRPSERALSDALTEALPPLDQAVLADVADAFRSLEEDRDALGAMTEAHTAAESFLGHYRRYARIAARRRAAQPRLAQSAYERVNRELTEAEAAHLAATEALAAAEEKLSELEQAGQRLRAREEVLRASPEMRSARELERSAEDARRLATDAKRASTDLEDATRQLTKRQRRDAEATERMRSTTAALERVRRTCIEAAEQARIASPHLERVDAVLDPERDAELRAQATTIADRQARAIVHIEQLSKAVERARQALADVRRRVEELAAEASELADQRQAAADTMNQLGTDLVSAVREHLSAATELRVAELAEALAALELWVETLDGVNPAKAAADAAAQVAATDLARLDAELDRRDHEARQRETELATEIARLETGEDTAPPIPHTRDESSRTERAGAPLWQLIDFADEVGPDERAGLESALEAAGILDAWLSPAGTLLDPDTDDVLLQPSAAQPAHSVAGVLRPAVDRENPQAAAVTDAVVDEVLASIGLGENGETWVSPDGRFRIGVLEGAWRKPSAVYIGRGAREAARRVRLTELRADLSTIESILAVIGTERGTLANRRSALAVELSTVPDDTELRNAHATVAGMVREQTRLATRQADAARKLGDATTIADTASTALADAATELDLPADTDALDEVREGLASYRATLAELWPALRTLADARRAAHEATEELAQATETLTIHTERSANADQESAAAGERYETLRETVGAAVAELERQLAEVTDGRMRIKEEQRGAGGKRDDAMQARAKAEGRRETLAADLERATGQRAEAAETMRRFVVTGLLAVALPDLETPDPDQPWAPDPTVRLARTVDRELAETNDDDPAWDRAQRRVTDELKTLTDTLGRQGNSASARLLEDGIVVDVVFRGRPGTVPELTAALADEVGERKRLLDEREREILENHLVNEVASTLQELISAAERQVALMNSELSARPTSTGMRLRLRLLWQAREDGPPGLAAARERLLRQTADAWSEEDRAAVGAFLQARIAEVRSRDTAGTWLEHLTEALDYRGWNRFVIQRFAGGAWRSATGPASGGERVLAASVPLFAAASAHYASAGNPHAPRLVTLDEAFAGVDDNARAKYLGLLAAFDLDVVMTSEREWGCYPEVPGLAISQLSRTDDVAAVLVSSWEWDGHRRTQVDRPQQAGLWS